VRQTEMLTREDFFKDETRQKAFVRSLEVVGEATKKIPDDFKARYNQVEWKAMAGMRDKLIHDYFGIDYEIVWDVVKGRRRSAPPPPARGMEPRAGTAPDTPPKFVGGASSAVTNKVPDLHNKVREILREESAG